MLDRLLLESDEVESWNVVLNSPGAFEKAQIAAASMTAAFLLSVGSADAGVIMAQPKLQKVSDALIHRVKLTSIDGFL